METENYCAKEGESFISIAAQFEMKQVSKYSPYSFLKLNGLSESSLIYPGMILKVRRVIEGKQEENKLNIVADVQDLAVPKSTFLRGNFTDTESVYYCTGQGDILGTITVTQAVAMFDPNLIFYESKQQDISKYQLCIDLCDLVNVNVLERKPKKEQQVKVESSESNQEQKELTQQQPTEEKEIIIQLLLSNTQTGRSKRSSREPVASVFFRIAEKKVSLSPRSFEEVRQSADSLEEIMRKAIEWGRKNPTTNQSLSKVPFYEVFQTYTPLLPKPNLIYEEPHTPTALKAMENSKWSSSSWSAPMVAKKIELRPPQIRRKTKEPAPPQLITLDFNTQIQGSSKICSQYQIDLITNSLPRIYRFRK